MKIKWRFGIIAGIFLAIYSFAPQAKLLYNRGSEWNGNYAYNDIDEVAYASYVRALMDGRPRKNNPYTGRDDSGEDPQQESLFSIQFAAPYNIAIPARILGIGTPWAMTLSGIIAAFLTAVAIFWLIGMMFRDNWYAMAGSLVVLAGGALFAGEGAVSEIFFDGFSYPYFPGFRRYIPAMAFPAFFWLVGLVWKMISRNDEVTRIGRSRWLIPGFAIACFAYAVFSYFYVWTTAAAWLACLGFILLAVRPVGVWSNIRSLAFVAAGALAALIPYAYLLSRRSHSMDDIQLLVVTHAPDLTRVPEIIAFCVLAALGAAIVLKEAFLADKQVIFTGALALSVIVVFNQQVITGQSLQPIHYQVFIGNYVAGLALVLTLGIYLRSAFEKRFKGVLALSAGLAFVAAFWGFIECYYTVRVLDDVNVSRDEALPTARRLTEMVSGDPNIHKRVVLDLDVMEADDLPTVAPVAVLWARHQEMFAGQTTEESRQRYYQLLFYEGVTKQELADRMKHGDFVSIIALFGWGRHTDRLNADYKPLTYREIDAAAEAYDSYIKNFDPRSEGAIKLDFMKIRVDNDQRLDVIDKWYERVEGEEIGKYRIYRLRLRS
ncbi:MAG: hypothetical protein JO053_10050 [Acidobacteria bacterium]|nr:hypothetical protein [Acidobacteriota bacterium]